MEAASLGRFVIGLLGLIVIVGSLAFGASRVRRRVLPGTSSATALLADVVLAVTGLFTVAYVLGALRAFAALPLVATCAVVGVVTGMLARGRTPPVAASPVPTSSKLELSVALGAVAVAVGSWVIATARILPHGIRSFDSIDYHLPHAARFAQDGWIYGLHHIHPEYPHAFHPSNSELVHAVGMTLFGQDLLSPFMNLAWLAGLLLAGWAIGADRGLGPISLSVAALVAAVPAFARDQGGTAANDTAAIFFLLASVAMVLRSDDRPNVLVVGGLAAGLALGTKLTVVAAVAILTVAVTVMAAHARRWRVLFAWILPLTLIGAPWYVRNLVHTGSPLPSIELGIGGVKLPYGGFAIVDEVGASVSEYLFDGRLWREWFVPALARYFGPAWTVVLGLIAIGVAAAIVSRSARVRAVGAVAALATVAYALTPTTALGPPGLPILFEGTLVYAMPAVALGLTASAAALSAERRVARITLVTAFALLLISAQASERSPWQEGSVAVGVVTVVCVVALAAVVSLLRRASAPAIALAALVVIVVAIAAWSVYGRRIDVRYTDDPLGRWAATVNDARFAEAGLINRYRLYGRDLSNHVEFVGSRGPHGAIHPASSCAQWRSALRRGGFDHVALRPGDFSLDSPLDDVEVELGLSAVGDRELVWTKTDPAAKHIATAGRVEIFGFDPDVADPGCPRASGGSADSR